MIHEQDNMIPESSRVNAPSSDTLHVDMPLPPVLPAAVQERIRPVFTGFEDHTITLADAGELTRNYRKHAGQGAVKGKYFSRAAVEQLLAQEDAVGIRYYYGVDNDGRQQMVLVGVDTNGKDMVEGFLYGNPMPMARFNSESNPLNS